MLAVFEADIAIGSDLVFALNGGGWLTPFDLREGELLEGIPGLHIPAGVDVTAQGSTAYVTLSDAFRHIGVQIVDASDRMGAVQRSTIPVDGRFIANVPDGAVLYISGRGVALRAINVFDLDNPAEIDRFDTGGNELAVSEGLVVLAGRRVTLVDASNPHELREVGSVELPLEAISVVAGNGVAFVSTERAIHVIDMTGCSPYLADVDDSGALDLLDFLEFQRLFDQGDVRGDFDRDGALTIFDFLAFQNAFVAGC